WFVPLIFLLRLKDREWRSLGLVSLIAIYLPVSVYAAIYLFTSWDPFTLHMEASLSRLLLQLSLVAALMIGLAIPNYSGRVVSSQYGKEEEEGKCSSQEKKFSHE